MEKAKLMQEKITEQRKLPEYLKEKLNNFTFINFLIAIAIMVYLLVINILYLNEEFNVFSYNVKIFAIVLILIDIGLFEIAYKKEKAFLWIFSFELLCISFLILAIPYIYMNDYLRKIYLALPIFISIYYVFKTILIHIIEIKKYQYNLSDVKEIIKDDEEGYLEVDDIYEDIEKIEKQKVAEMEIIREAKKKK